MFNRYQIQILALTLVALVLLCSGSSNIFAQKEKPAGGVSQKEKKPAPPKVYTETKGKGFTESKPNTSAKEQPTHMKCQCGKQIVYCLVGYSKDCESCCKRFDDSKNPSTR